jgi:hypothetical protein
MLVVELESTLKSRCSAFPGAVTGRDTTTMLKTIVQSVMDSRCRPSPGRFRTHPCLLPPPPSFPPSITPVPLLTKAKQWLQASHLGHNVGTTDKIVLWASVKFFSFVYCSGQPTNCKFLVTTGTTARTTHPRGRPRKTPHLPVKTVREVVNRE